MQTFHVIRGQVVKEILSRSASLALKSVENAYLAHHDGKTINPDSYFLRFNDPRNRIIALPAYIGSDVNVAGIKWIASFPGNIEVSVPRASAVLILNDPQTGYPFSCLEAAQISAARTAASAVLGAYWINGNSRLVKSVAFVGAGVIACNIFDTFNADGWNFDEILIRDTDAVSVASFAKHIEKTKIAVRSVSLDEALTANVVVFATNSGKPYVPKTVELEPKQIILNISLRDVAPELILQANNVFDDVEHCMKANTSPHLAEQLLGSRSFVTGTLAQLIRGEISLDEAKPTIYSPFGMGILDLALGKAVHHIATTEGLAMLIPDFFGETQRW